MSSKAKLPGAEVHDLLRDAIEAAEDLEAFLRELRDKHPDWVTWNLGGEAFGKPQYRGPGVWNADQFADVSGRVRRRLEAVEQSFQRRAAKEAERREARRERAR